MLFDSSIRKELGRSFGATLVILITVVMTMMLIRTLGQATKGVVSPSDVLLVMGLTVLGHMPTILTLSLFVAVVGTVARMYRDSEMSVWFSSGQGLASMLAPILRFGWPIVAVIAVLALVAWPWSNQQILQIRAQYEQRGDLDRIAPGEFQESSDGSRVIFIDKDSVADESASNIFLVETRDGREYVTSARQAHVEKADDGARHAVLTSGQRLENNARDGDLKLTHFDTYRLQLDDAPPAKPYITTRALSTQALLGDPAPVRLAELGWRLGLPLAALNLLILALVITVMNPRGAQSKSLLVALLTFIVYYNLLSVGQSWVSSGQLSMLSCMLVIHGSIFVIAVLGLVMRNNRWQFRDLFQRRRTAA